MLEHQLKMICCSPKTGAIASAVYSAFYTVLIIIIAIILLSGVVIVHNTTDTLDELEQVALMMLKVSGIIFSITGVISGLGTTALIMGLIKENHILIILWLAGDAITNVIILVAVILVLTMKYFWFALIFLEIAWKVYLWLATLSYLHELRAKQSEAFSVTPLDFNDVPVYTIPSNTVMMRI